MTEFYFIKTPARIAFIPTCPFYPCGIGGTLIQRKRFQESRNDLSHRRKNDKDEWLAKHYFNWHGQSQKSNSSILRSTTHCAQFRKPKKSRHFIYFGSRPSAGRHVGALRLGGAEGVQFLPGSGRTYNLSSQTRIQRLKMVSLKRQWAECGLKREIRRSWLKFA